MNAEPKGRAPWARSRASKSAKPGPKRGLARALKWLSIVPILGAGLYALFLAPSPVSVSIVNATVESFTFEVSSPELTKIPLAGFNIVNGDEPPPPAVVAPIIKGRSKKPTVMAANFYCYTGILIPAYATRITYTRFGDAPVDITLERSDGLPVGTFEAGTQEASTSLKSASRLKLTAVNKDDKSSKGEKTSEKAADDCDGRPAPRLPVYGFGDLGSETSPTGQSSNKNLGTLIEGTVDVLAHAVQFRSNANGSSNVYSTNNQTILPPGSRLVQFKPEEGQKQPWIGFAVIGDSSIELHVTSDAKRLAIIRPGQEARPEILSVGLLAQVANDPIFAAVQIFGALMFSVFQILGAFVGGGTTRRGFNL